MALTPIKALLFLAGGAAAAGGVAYVSGVFDPYLDPDAKMASAPAPEASETPAPGASQANPKMARLPQPPGANVPAGEAPAAGTPAQEVLPPSFDVVRVEGDGSIVIAGKAVADATVEIVTGARVIGNAVAGPDGDFAVVIDEPLKPGGHQIVLRSTAPDNVVATSLETAVVSIPEKPDGQVLALVEKPGEPSKLITVPEPQPAPSLKGDAAAPEAPASAGAAPAAPEEKPTSGEPEASASAEAEAPAEEAPPAEQPATAQAPEPAPADAASGKPAEQAAAAKPDQEPVQLAPSAPSGEPQVTVEAVEIEGRKVFVAGVADPGRKVRVYANDILLGDADASPSGRFLIETERDLPVGDYIIRADALEPDGVKVAARAAVPFEREEGENLAAVAPSAPQAEPPATGADRPAAAAPTAAAPQSAAPTPAKPSAEPDAKPSAEAQASTEAPASGEPSLSADTPAAPDATPPITPPATADASPPASGTEAPQPATPPTATAEADAPSTQPTEQPGESAAASAGGTTAPASESTPTTSAEVETAKPATNSEVAAAPEGMPLAPKLESAPGAVIIRRGDSLWRISRRVYGLGVRYSTIYLANQEQISDPDLIWPGQVFKVPEKTSEGEEADMKAVGEQAVTTTTQ
ncbi:LysM peptidoglycan-binding domain-containing protein [Allomesorhizobium camelthorni]|uniref:LysM peptidoglycan-binding domain-containing protein n=1 Tax=Allomesorhizobium camelthorni TaxID=475069 RepID=A0A6G4WGR9_9HYPH|nr:LysM peptidoglycan-binding domain-containing protein [Mesorhizobium camelthorni]NGO53992.1 LysM peptidoglycan-binding domain-containing protein [Mesorhizobium camelthorni]